MQTIKQAYEAFRSKLSALYDASETEAIAGLCISEVTGWTKARQKAFPEQELNTEQTNHLQNLLAELQTGKPLQYILGYTDFYGLKFKVTPAVLIPRPETEELVEWILQTASKTNSLHILDIGTGSGCIAITLKHYLPNSVVNAWDIEPDALAVAKLNAEANQTSVQFMETNALAVETASTMKYDVIVSNPPYVTPAEQGAMHPNVLQHEPHTALFVPQNEPLLFYYAIAGIAAKSLKPGGFLFLEINESFGKETVELLMNKHFTNVELRKDLRGKDRMVKAVWPG